MILKIGIPIFFQLDSMNTAIGRLAVNGQKAALEVLCPKAQASAESRHCYWYQQIYHKHINPIISPAESRFAGILF